MAKLLEKVKMQMIMAIARRVPACREIAPLISQACERKLTWRESWQLRLHLFTCRMCTRYMQQLGFLRDTVKLQTQATEQETSHATSPRLSDAARTRLAEVLKKDAGAHSK